MCAAVSRSWIGGEVTKRTSVPATWVHVLTKRTSVPATWVHVLTKHTAVPVQRGYTYSLSIHRSLCNVGTCTHKAYSSPCATWVHVLTKHTSVPVQCGYMYSQSIHRSLQCGYMYSQRIKQSLLSQCTAITQPSHHQSRSFELDVVNTNGHKLTKVSWRRPVAQLARADVFWPSQLITSQSRPVLTKPTYHQSVGLFWPSQLITS